MKEGNNVEAIIDKMAREIFKSIVRLKKVDSKSPHGIYIYDPKRDEWVLVRSEGRYFNPRNDGFYIIYFDNTKCPACRKYDNYWFPYVSKNATKLEKHYFVIILCEWFARNCRSRAASESFRHYDVHASPTTILLYIKNGKIIHQEKYEGYLTYEELEKVVGEFRDRALRAERGEKVELPKKTLEEELLELLKKILSSTEKVG